MQRLSVWMLLLPIILAPDLQGAEEESGVPRLLVLFPSQLHSSGRPAGGALGLAGARHGRICSTKKKKNQFLNIEYMLS